MYERICRKNKDSVSSITINKVFRAIENCEA